MKTTRLKTLHPESKKKMNKEFERGERGRGAERERERRRERERERERERVCVCVSTTKLNSKL